MHRAAESDGTTTAISFTLDAGLKATASKSNGLPKVDELRAATLRWFQKWKPDMCLPMLVVDVKREGGEVLFTPPYCPDLQPIELFWAAGKNWARENNTDHSRTLEKTVAHLRAGWHTRNGKGAKCDRLVAKSIEKANERVAYDEFLSGTVEGGLVVSGEVDLEIGVDLIGRATRALCKRALERGALDEDEDDSALHGDDGASDDDDDDDDDGGEF